jgi:hypothetical protein
LDGCLAEWHGRWLAPLVGQHQCRCCNTEGGQYLKPSFTKRTWLMRARDLLPSPRPPPPPPRRAARPGMVVRAHHSVVSWSNAGMVAAFATYFHPHPVSIHTLWCSQPPPFGTHLRPTYTPLPSPTYCCSTPWANTQSIRTRTPSPASRGAPTSVFITRYVCTTDCCSCVMGPIA